MSTFIQPYEGKRPYVFISYSHRDSETVLNILAKLNERKLRFWYDEGIPAGSDWPKNIELHMRECAAVLFFLSKTALESPNCFSEIKTAAALGKPVLLVPLEDTPADPKWSALLARADRLKDSNENAPDEAICAWKTLRRSFYRKWTDAIRGEWIGLILALLLLGAAAAGLIALMQGRFDSPAIPTPTPTEKITPAVTPDATEPPIPTPSIDPSLFPIQFPDTQQENAVREIIGKETGDVLRPELAAVEELYFCGSMTLGSTDDVTLDRDGTARVNGAPVITGKVSDLSVIGAMAYLKKLALIDQPVKDLSLLNGLTLLDELYLSGCDLSDLSALTDLPRLKTLHIEHTKIHDLTALDALPSLETVTVSADMLPLAWTEGKSYRVILVP